jgi:hypothetical protein
MYGAWFYLVVARSLSGDHPLLKSQDGWQIVDMRFAYLDGHIRSKAG